MIMDKYVVIGNPVMHSKSPEIHNRFAMNTKQKMHFTHLLTPLNNFFFVIRNFFNEGGKGASITLPFKLEAYTLADILTQRASFAGAVNTLKLENGIIYGDNTDGLGLIIDIIQNFGMPIIDKRILLLGAGGAASGVLLPLLQQKPSSLVLCNRSYNKALILFKKFNKYAQLSVCKYSDLDGTYDLIINATSASLENNLPYLLPINIFSKASLAYDMMYDKTPTIFMQYASQHGAIIRDGLGMLVEQAAEAFYFWRGIKPKTTSILTMLRATLT